MKPNNFIFADLSTYTPKETMAFYQTVFGWTYYEADGYYSAYKGDKEICGLYETPENVQTDADATLLDVLHSGEQCGPDRGKSPGTGWYH